MPEYFDMSFITEKTSISQSEMKNCLGTFGLIEGENRTKLFGGRQVIVSFFEDEETDFEETSIGLPDQKFHKESFDDELKEITNFINQCFKSNCNIKYALCGYEINGYLLRGIKSLQEFNNDLLKRFPIVYKRTKPSGLPSIQINLGSQDIFNG
jgi:hypothetical protein